MTSIDKQMAFYYLIKGYRTGLWGPLKIWARAPSHADDMPERGGVPSRSVIRSNWEKGDSQDAMQNTKKNFWVWFSFNIHQYLLYGALSLEKNAPTQQLCKDAAYRPNVYRWRVMLASHQDLWSAVILRHHLLGHVTRRVRLLHSCQTEVTNLNKRSTVTFLTFSFSSFVWLLSACGTLSRQLLLTSRFPGLMSLCRMPAECRYFSPETQREFVLCITNILTFALGALQTTSCQMSELKKFYRYN